MKKVNCFRRSLRKEELLELAVGGSLGDLVGGSSLLLLVLWLLLTGLSNSLGSGFLGSLGSGLSAELDTSSALGVGVELDESTEILQWVLLAGVSLLLLLDWAKLALDFVGVDDSGEVGVGDLGVGETVVDLSGGGLLVGSVEVVQSLKSTTGPDDESANVTSGSEEEEVETVDVDELNSGDVSERLNHWGLLVVDDQGASSLDVSSVSELTLSASDLAGILGLFNIGVGGESLEDLDGLRGLLNVEDAFVAEDEWDLRDLFDSVSSGQDQRSGSAGGESGDDSESSLVLVDLSVPSAVGLGGGEHTSSTAHVTESSLSGAVGSSSRNTWNTSDGTTSTPGLSRSLVTCFSGDSVGLSSVLGDISVNVLNDIETDGGAQDSWETGLGHRLAIGSRVDRD